MHAWAELWHQFIATMGRQPVAVVLAVWVGLALVLVMALEGLLLNLFPGCVFRRYLEKMPHRERKSSAPAVIPPVSAPPVVAVPVAVAQVEPPPPVAEPVSSPPKAAETPALVSKTRRPKNRKKPAPGPKTARATGWRRVPRQRLSRAIPKLLAPKN